jgi:UDP-glucuronate 4-epimerase
VVVTGAAGFVGMHTACRLLDAGHRVIGIDSLDDYYPRVLKEARLAQLATHARADALRMEICDIADAAAIERVFDAEAIVDVVHLAAQAGVRYSMIDPLRYARSNLVGTTVILEACRHHRIRHLVYASSSSVYGNRADPPFRESDIVDSPASFYAATKRSNELMVQTYASLYRLRCTGLRLFTVYGPWGRPDMAPWLFTERILRGVPIQIFGAGRPRRDFTFVDDCADNIARLLDRPLAVDPDQLEHQVVNIGSDNPVPVATLIEIVERHTGRRAERDFRPLPPGDVGLTAADPTLLEALGGARPHTPLDIGIERFVSWYRQYPQLADAVWQSRAGEAVAKPVVAAGEGAVK